MNRYAQHLINWTLDNAELLLEFGAGLMLLGFLDYCR